MLTRNKWLWEKYREIKNTGYKLWFIGKEKHRNRVAIIVDKILKENVVDIKRLGDRIIELKLDSRKEMLKLEVHMRSE